MYVKKKNAKQPILLYIKNCAFVSNTWKTCPLQIYLKHWKCELVEIGVNCKVGVNFDKILSLKDPLLH